MAAKRKKKPEERTYVFTYRREITGAEYVDAPNIKEARKRFAALSPAKLTQEGDQGDIEITQIDKFPVGHSEPSILCWEPGEAKDYDGEEER